MQSFDQDIPARSNNHKRIEYSCRDGIYQFKAEEDPNVRFSAMKNNPLCGILFSHLLRLLHFKEVQRWKYGGAGVDWHVYPHRITALLLISIFNSFLSICEWIYMKLFLSHEIQRIARIDNKDPVFILGQPRSGTTLLHSLLALDTHRFCYCNTFCAGFPWSFLIFETWGKRIFSGILSSTRPMDNMPLHFDLPQEDELATSLFTGATCSPYISLYFMRDESFYRKFQTMNSMIHASTPHCSSTWSEPDSTTYTRQADYVSDKDLASWVHGFQHLLMKLKCRDLLLQKRQGWKRDLDTRISPRQLLLKSPCHTGRVQLLLKLFPKAKFIYIHRDPYEVFLSGAYMASTTYGYMFLQRPSDAMLQEYILKQGELLVNEYLRCKEMGLLNTKNLVEISFHELTMNPFDTIQNIYKQCDFKNDDDGHFNQQLKTECSLLRNYKRNNFGHCKLDDKLVQEIQVRWRNQFESFGYSLNYNKKST